MRPSQRESNDLRDMKDAQLVTTSKPDAIDCMDEQALDDVRVDDQWLVCGLAR